MKEDKTKRKTMMQDLFGDFKITRRSFMKRASAATGGAIALGHPLGCTGTKLSVQLFDEMRARGLKGKYGMVTMCVGTGQGAAGIYEFLS